MTTITIEVGGEALRKIKDLHDARYGPPNVDNWFCGMDDVLLAGVAHVVENVLPEPTRNRYTKGAQE